jgi:hypothetical protein
MANVFWDHKDVLIVDSLDYGNTATTDCQCSVYTWDAMTGHYHNKSGLRCQGIILHGNNNLPMVNQNSASLTQYVGGYGPPSLQSHFHAQ